MTRKAIVLFSILFFSILNSATAQIKLGERIGLLPVPAFGYSPETKFYIGAVGLFTIRLSADTNSRTSNAKLEFNYTWNKQVITEAAWQLFLKDEKYFTEGFLHYSKYPDLYYGIGLDSKASDEERFVSSRLIIRAEGRRRLVNNLYAGIGLRYANYSQIEFFHSVIHHPELVNPNRYYGLSASLISDARNNLLSPSQGHFFRFWMSQNSGETDYFKWHLDIRKYRTIRKKIIVSSRFYNEYTGSRAIFHDMGLYGGDDIARGYLKGRYRDQNLSTVQYELRAKIYKRIGASVFGGFGIVYSDISAVNWSKALPNAGVGIRILADKKEGINLRLDYAVGRDGNSGFYVSFGESF